LSIRKASSQGSPVPGIGTTTLEIFLSCEKNFGVGIEPTRTSLTGGAPFAFPMHNIQYDVVDLIANIIIGLSVFT